MHVEQLTQGLNNIHYQHDNGSDDNMLIALEKFSLVEEAFQHTDGHNSG